MFPQFISNQWGCQQQRLDLDFSHQSHTNVNLSEDPLAPEEKGIHPPLEIALDNFETGDNLTYNDLFL